MTTRRTRPWSSRTSSYMCRFSPYVASEGGFWPVSVVSFPPALLCTAPYTDLAGVGSDFLIKVLKASRVWCLVASSLIFALAQICAMSVTNPHFLGAVSGLSGLAYGILFGVYPSIVAETFGIHGLSQNWGILRKSVV